ncbi:MAG: energy transducer TonB [Blastocatellales bacterium]
MIFPVSNRALRASRLVQPLALAFLFLLTMTGKAQDNGIPKDLSSRPIFVTARFFQLTAPAGKANDLTDQVFRMKTSSLVEDEQWMTAFEKTYPGFNAALLSTEKRKVFRTSKPAVISFAKQRDGRSIEVQLFGAQSPGDGTTPGTNLIPDIGLHFGNDIARPPVSYAIQPLEIESGTTYFFAIQSLRFSPQDYIKFIRPTAQPAMFQGRDVFLVVAFSVDLDTTVEPERYVDERGSLEMQKKAVRQAQLEVPAEMTESGAEGFIRVRVEIAPTGKVTGAYVHYSSFPELNQLALKAARQWEFPESLFAEDRKPITGFIAFSISGRKSPADGVKPAANR